MADIETWISGACPFRNRKASSSSKPLHRQSSPVCFVTMAHTVLFRHLQQTTTEPASSAELEAKPSDHTHFPEMRPYFRRAFLSFSDMRTKWARDSACVFSITCAR